jgi:ubiquinone/menaquinone biosynthesis C-methylase UbiE
MSIDRDAAGGFRVLDVGCGAGDSLNEEFQLLRGELKNASRIELVGIDIDEAALAQGRMSYPDFLFVCAKGEQLPFPEESFDVVISRVAMPYMDIPVVLREIRRVLKVGGELKIKLHPLSFTLSELAVEMRSGSLRERAQNFVYRIYVVANGAVLHFAGFNFRFSLSRQRCESFQTRRGIRRALVAAGFGKIDVSCWETQITWPHCGDCRTSARHGD